MKIKAIRCLKCKDVIFSRARHDFRPCSCGSVFVDGGFDYLRFGTLKQGVKLDSIEQIEIHVDATKKELYNDWNISEDKWGLVKGR